MTSVLTAIRKYSLNGSPENLKSKPTPFTNRQFPFRRICKQNRPSSRMKRKLSKIIVLCAKRLLGICSSPCPPALSVICRIQKRDVHCRYRDFRTPDRLPYPDIWFNLTQLPKTNPPGIRFHRATYPKNKMNTSRYFFLRTSFRGAEFSLTFLPKNDIMQSVKTTANRKNTKI